MSVRIPWRYAAWIVAACICLLQYNVHSQENAPRLPLLSSPSDAGSRTISDEPVATTDDPVKVTDDPVLKDLTEMFLNDPATSRRLQFPSAQPQAGPVATEPSSIDAQSCHAAELLLRAARLLESNGSRDDANKHDSRIAQIRSLARDILNDAEINAPSSTIDRY